MYLYRVIGFPSGSSILKRVYVGILQRVCLWSKETGMSEGEQKSSTECTCTAVVAPVGVIDSKCLWSK